MIEPTDRHQPRHVDRRDQGMRRQRLVTQAAAGGATALALLFGWSFAQPATASDPAPAPAKQQQPPATKKPAAKKPAAGSNQDGKLKPPEQAPAEEPPAQQEAAPPPDTQSGGS